MWDDIKKMWIVFPSFAPLSIDFEIPQTWEALPSSSGSFNSYAGNEGVVNVAIGSNHVSYSGLVVVEREGALYICPDNVPHEVRAGPLLRLTQMASVVIDRLGRCSKNRWGPITASPPAAPLPKPGNDPKVLEALGRIEEMLGDVHRKTYGLH